MAPSASAASSSARSGIQTTSDGSSYIPSSTRADGSTRKEIRVRPGYRPPEDVETYKNRSAEAWKTRGGGGVPGAEVIDVGANKEEAGTSKSKNAKRRETAKKRAKANGENEVSSNTKSLSSEFESGATSGSKTLSELNMNISSAAPLALRFGNDNESECAESAAEADRLKKVRNLQKKLRAVRELKAKKEAGEKVSHDQLLKIGKETELLRDLQKLGHEAAFEADSKKLVDDTQGRANG